jgi:hypothetical protein
MMRMDVILSEAKEPKLHLSEEAGDALSRLTQ